jgi:general secretion pathway protein A
MYTSFFGLSEKPFAITPDPRYLYLSERHAEALAHLLYGINESGGFIQLTGEVGTGKTTVVRTLLSRIPHHADVAVIMNPRITPAEFLLTICEELGVALEEAEHGSVKQMVDALNRRLLSAHAEGRRVIVIVDEAQNLSAEVLEQVRLLTNLETPTQKLLQIILIGQPELRDLLDRTELRQLAQRITGRYHLNPLSREETMGYVRHRLRVAGSSGEIFTAAALSEIHRLSSGIPRVINVTCDRALLGAYTRELRSVTPSLVRRAGGEVYGRRFTPPWLAWVLGAGVLAAVAGAGVIVWRASLWQPLAAALHASLAGSPHPKAAMSAPAASVAPAAGTTSAATPAPAAIATSAAMPSDTLPPAAAATSPSTLADAATAVPAIAPASPRAPPSINALLEANAVNTTDAAAYRRLLALWGTALPNDHDPCGQAAKAGLACLDQRGSWTQVRLLNRPAILTLSDDRGQRHRVVLRSLDDDTATLVVGERDVRVPLQELSAAWLGEFTVVWKPKTQRPRDLSVGMSGDQVRWLRRSLATLRGTADPDHGDTYDQDLAIAVQNFQRSHRLNVDGIAGIQTQVVLDTVLADPGSPLLSSTAPRGS